MKKLAVQTPTHNKALQNTLPLSRKQLNVLSKLRFQPKRNHVAILMGEIKAKSRRHLKKSQTLLAEQEIPLQMQQMYWRIKQKKL